MTEGARLPPPDLPGLDPRWSTHVPVTDGDGATHTWHVLDNAVADPVGTLLCVHGNPTWSYLWRRLLAQAPARWRVVAPDHLGMGYSERSASPRTLAQRITDLGDLTEALGVTGPVVTVGHDWGGAISLGWAIAHPGQLRGVVLTNTAVQPPEHEPGPLLIRLAHAPALRDTVCVRTPAFVRGASALSRPPLPRAVRSALAAPYSSSGRRRAVGDFVADIPFTRDHPSRRTLEAVAQDIRGIDVPVLLLWGPRDPVFQERYLADLRSRLPQATLHRFEGASHLVQEDAPQYAEAVSAWVQDCVEVPGASLTPAATEAFRSDPVGEPSAGPVDESLWSAIEARADDPSPAVVEVGGARVSWALLATRVREISAGLVTAGLHPGDRVALLVPPSADLTAAVYAVWRAGGVIVVADKGLGMAGMRRALRSADVDHVIGSWKGLVAARLMGLRGTRFAAGPIDRSLMRRLGAERGLADLARLGRVAEELPIPSPEQDCAVVFTSGATGPAKGVVYRHRQAVAQIQLVRSTYALTSQDRFVAAFAPFALLGPALGVGSAVPDIDVTAPGTLTAAGLADAVAAVDATVVFASPAALRSVSATGGRLTSEQRSALEGVRLLMSAGAPVPASLLHDLAVVLPHAEAHTPYGMTEALPVTDIALHQIDAAEADAVGLTVLGAGNGVCVGPPLPGVTVAVSPLSSLGSADGPPTQTSGVTGEICVRANHVKDRYDALWATEHESSRNPGWHRTGDVGHLDDAGRLWVEGRLAHVIATAGSVVTPVGVEQRVEAVSGVSAAAVVGVGPVGAQVVVVVVVPADSGPTATAGSSPVAEPGLADAVRSAAGSAAGAAGVDVAAVLVAADLPRDIRHASKVDRREVARWATEVLAGGRRRLPSR